MRPGQIALSAELADNSVGGDLKCPGCGAAWPFEAEACGSCGWQLPTPQTAKAAAPCSNCHRSIDAVTGRCLRCHPFRIEDIDPAIQEYVRRARSEKLREFVMCLSVGSIFMGFWLYYVVFEESAPPVFAFTSIGTLAFAGIGVRLFLRRRKLLARYHRLGFVMRYVKPIAAELRYSTRRDAAYFYVCRLAPGSVWRGVRENKIRVDFPTDDGEQLVNDKYSPVHLDYWMEIFKGWNPLESDHFFAKVYFDPDESGSAVIRVANSIFVSAAENYDLY